MKIYLIISFILAFITADMAAQVPVPAEDQDQPILLMGAIAHIGDGTVIENSVVAFEKGVITIVADARLVRLDLSKYKVYDLHGQHVYPGFILPNTPIGLQEVSAIRAMTDQSEEGSINPNVRSIMAYNTDSEFIPTMRFNGILLAESTPTGGLISGCSSLMEMEGWNWEDATHTQDVAIHLNWPNRMNRRFDFATFSVKDEANKNYEKEVAELEKHFTDAMLYDKTSQTMPNLKLESMQGLFDGSTRLSIHADEPKEIIESIKFSLRHGVKNVVLIAGVPALMVSTFLKEHNIPVIIPPVHSLPDRSHHDIHLPYKLPHLLNEAGIEVSLSHSGMLSNARNLPFYAGTAAAYGMDKEEALKTIALHPARALGVDKRLGTIEAGKDATIFVSLGDALDIRTNILSYAFIRGKEVVLPNKQQELFERYSKKYGHIK